MNNNILDKLDGISARYYELSGLLSLPEIISQKDEFRRLSKEFSDLADIVSCFEKHKDIIRNISGNQELLDDHETDSELRVMAEEENKTLRIEKEKLELELKLLLIPKDPNDEKNIIIEIRAGTGGEEASLFTADLFRMYSKYAEFRKWRVEVMSRTETGRNGIKEIIASIEGKGVYSRLKYESGAHRVQRVPDTEASGRIHTSAATVAILPEAEEVEINIDPTEIRFDVFRASGCGGQHVNTTDSAVRLTHIPTGIVVSMQDEKSQLKNKDKAMKILRARLFDKYRSELDADRAQFRKEQVGSGDRSEKIRTYNFPQGRFTDHRIGMTLYKLDSIINGDLEEVIDKLAIYYQADSLQKGELDKSASFSEAKRGPLEKETILI